MNELVIESFRRIIPGKTNYGKLQVIWGTRPKEKFVLMVNKSPLSGISMPPLILGIFGSTITSKGGENIPFKGLQEKEAQHDSFN